MKKALLSLLLAIACMPMAFGQSKALVTTDTTACGRFTWSVDGNTYTRDTSVMYIQGENTYVLHLTMLTSTPDTTTAIPVNGVCSATWNHREWKTPGTFLDTLTATNGCDSIVKISVTLGGTDTISKTVTRCGSYETPWGAVLTESTSFADSLIHASYCDVLATLNLTINPIVMMPTVPVTADCSYSWRDLTITDGNVHYDTLSTTRGCDSIISVQVTAFSHETHDTINIVACDSYIYNGDTLTSNGFYTEVDSSTDCHIYTHIQLTIVNSFRDTATTVVRDIIGGCRVNWLGDTYSFADTNRVIYGMGTTTLGNCDSLMAIRITSFTGVQHDTTFVDNCGKYRWALNNTTYENSGVYSVTDTTPTCIENKYLALSIIALHDTIVRDSCEHCTYIFPARAGLINGAKDRANFSASGIYDVDENGDTLYSTDFSTKCVTYHTMVLTIYDVQQLVRDQDVDTSVCDVYNFTFGGINRSIDYDVDTTLIRSRRTVRNCYDSIGHFKVTIKHKSYEDYNITTCDSYYWSFTGETYTSTTTKVKTLDSIQNAQGCDSIGRLNLTINYTPVVSIVGNWHLNPDSTNIAELSADDDPADHNTYKWFKNNEANPFSTQKTVEVTVSDNTDIHLETTSNKGCTANNWITITYHVGIDQVENLNVNLYPNPASRFLNVESAEGLSQVVIYNAIGQQVVVRRDINANALQLDLGNLAIGTYTMQIRSLNGEQATRKFIVNK